MTLSKQERKARYIRAVIYIRYSSHNQDGSYTVEAQHEECMRYIERRGYKFIKQYVDTAKTGKKVAGRDSFEEMIRDAHDKLFDKIVVFTFSRAFRNTMDALNYNFELREKCGVIIESVLEPVDMDSPHGKFSATNLFAMHELQSDIIAGHVKSGMYYAAQEGYYLGGTVNYGYELYGTGEFSRGKERKKYRINEAEAENVREMYRLYASGFSLDYIQEEMARRGVHGRRSGKVMSIQTLARILRKPFYIGTREYKVDGYPPISIEKAVPAIVDEDIWHKVQAKHAKNEAKSRQSKRTKRVYALTGKVFCSKCGSHYHGNNKADKRAKKEYTYYSCADKKSLKTCDAKNIRKDELEAYCVREIKKYILNEDAMQRIAEHIVEIIGKAPDDVKNEIKKLTRRRRELAEAVKKLVKKNALGEMPDDVYREASADFNTEIAEIDLQLVQLEAVERNAITVPAVMSYLHEMFENIDSVDPVVLKTIFEKLIERIDIDDTHVELRLRVSPYPSIGDKESHGQPQYCLSLTAHRYEISPPTGTGGNMRRIKNDSTRQIIK